MFCRRKTKRYFINESNLSKNFEKTRNFRPTFPQLSENVRKIFSVLQVLICSDETATNIAQGKRKEVAALCTSENASTKNSGKIQIFLRHSYLEGFAENYHLSPHDKEASFLIAYIAHNSNKRYQLAFFDDLEKGIVSFSEGKIVLDE